MKTSDRRALREAADVLNEYADELHASHTVDGTWPAGETDARLAYNREKRLAARLVTIADMQ